MNDHYLPVDDSLSGNAEGAGDLGKPFGPVEPVAGVDFPLSLVQVDLDPIAIEFDFVKPPVPSRSLGLQGGQLGLDEPRHLRRDRGRFGTLGHYSTQQNATLAQ